MDDKDEGVQEGPLARVELLEAGAHHDQGRHELDRVDDRLQVVDGVVQRLHGLRPERVVQVEAVVNQMTNHLNRGHDAAGDDHHGPEVELDRGDE